MMQTLGRTGGMDWAIAEGCIPSEQLAGDAPFVNHETVCRLDVGNAPERMPCDADYSSLIETDVPFVVQHTRFDSMRAELTLLSTMAYPGGDR
jgi:hypothetical protein